MRPSISPILPGILLALAAGGATAQTTAPIDELVELGFTGSSKTYLIPTGVDSVRLEVKGATGGDATTKQNMACRSEGGLGARIGGTFSIGTDFDQLEPGGQLRFIVGGAGEDAHEQGVISQLAAAGGGGGSGILYRAPGGSEWIPLLVAGGGGGAAQRSNAGVCGEGADGRDAQLGETGGDGESAGSQGEGGLGGNNGNGGAEGEAPSDGAGGGGLLTDGGATEGSNEFGRKGLPIGGNGGKHGPANDGLSDGGWGCGGGGASASWSGGGGGGYSGGGGGGGGPSKSAGGGGGGSFVSEWASSVTKGLASSPRDGTAEFRFWALGDGDTCEQAIDIPDFPEGVSQVIEGDNIGYGSTPIGQCVSNSGQPDRWYRFSNPKACPQRLYFRVLTQSIALEWHVVEAYDGCDTLNALGCYEPELFLPPSIGEVDVPAGGSVLLRVVSESALAQGAPYQLILESVSIPIDSDGDLVIDCVDNCITTPNSTQADSDGDGVGDACDICPGGDDTIDSDGDGTPDDCDVCPGDNSQDMDGDGVPDACDTCIGDNSVDGDFDGIPDACDPCIGVPLDCNGNGLSDVCELAGAGRFESFDGFTNGLYTLQSSTGGLGPVLELQALVLTPIYFLANTASVTFDPISPEPLRDFEAEFWFRIDQEGNVPGGLSFSLFDAAEYDDEELFDETGPGANSLTISFDVHDDGVDDPNGNHIEVLVDGASFGIAAPGYSLGSDVWRKARLTVSGAVLNLTLEDPSGNVAPVFQNLAIPTFDPFVARYGLGARSASGSPAPGWVRTTVDQVLLRDRSGDFVVDLDGDGALDACVSGTQSIRLGSPPNANALRYGSETAPMLDGTYRPFIDHTFFMPEAEMDFLSISFEQTNIPLAPFGTLLGGVNPPVNLSQPVGSAFEVELPGVGSLVGADLTFTGASMGLVFTSPSAPPDFTLLLTNAIDTTVTGWQPE